LKAIPSEGFFEGVIRIGVFGSHQSYKVLELFDRLSDITSVTIKAYISDPILSDFVQNTGLLPGESVIGSLVAFENSEHPAENSGSILVNLTGGIAEEIQKIASQTFEQIPGVILTIQNEPREFEGGFPVIRFSEGWDYIFEAIAGFNSPDNFWQNKNVLVTAGRTEEEIDPVRIITNRSSGKMGFALARQAARKGANVWLVAGPNNLKTPFGVHQVDVKTADEMLAAATRYFQKADVVFAAAAVEDLKPERISDQKIKKGGEYQIECTNAVDVLQSLADRKQNNQLLIGFSVETENEIEHSREKLEKKSLDAIVINNPREHGAGFQHDTNKVTVLTKNGTLKKFPLMSKDELASELLKFIAENFLK